MPLLYSARGQYLCPVYSSLKACVEDLERQGQLFRIKEEVDPDLEMAEIHRRVFESGGPALFFEKIKSCRFPAVSNLYGTRDRILYLFRKSLGDVQALGQLKNDPGLLLKKPFTYLPAALKARFALPRKQRFNRSMVHTCKISDLPQIRSWPMDGGPFVLLPQVLSLPPGTHDLLQSNLGMYRIQLGGNDYLPDQEIGLHYQLHRGIGIHHKMYLESDEPFRVSVFIGGPPSHALSAIFPLPEGMSELTFAGLLNRKRFSWFLQEGYVLSDQADFVITGTIDKELKKPEGPFGDHLGYYSLRHDFPVMKVDRVYHRKDAIWHFTVVGRPPQEDSYFGFLIHEVVKDLIPREFPGLTGLHAVDVAGVHPLLLATGKERYMPFREPKPEEILTISSRILGSGQTSLAKYLFIAAPLEQEKIDLYDFPGFFTYLLSRIRFERDLHFITNTTMDTLDYSGEGWNAGSKVILACCGPVIRSLTDRLPDNLVFPTGYKNPALFQSGILCVEGTRFMDYAGESHALDQWISHQYTGSWEGIALIVICDDTAFTAANWENFIWVAFTRSNPSHDVYGIGPFTIFKHWGCRGPLIIDARIKPQHAPVLVPDPAISARVDRKFSKGGSLYELSRK